MQKFIGSETISAELAQKIRNASDQIHKLHRELRKKTELKTSCIYLYLQTKVLHPFLEGRGYRSLCPPQGLGALLTAPQKTRVTGHIQSSSSNGHLGSQPLWTKIKGHKVKRDYLHMISNQDTLELCVSMFMW